MNPQKQLEGVTFTLLPLEAKAIFEMVASEGFLSNSQGIKAFLVSLAMEEEAEEENEGGDLSEAVKRILEVAEKNPEVTKQAIKKGTQILSTLMDKLKG
jgi:hypothetical protein